jgi:two-component system, chemotaxis family, sensor kinase CheA
VSASRYTELFRSESREHIARINDLLLALEADPTARQPVDEVFRSVHNIKGMAATVGCEAAAAVAHEVETILERFRSQHVAVGGRLLDVLFRAIDALESAVERFGDDGGDVAAPGVIAELRALSIARVFSGESGAPAPGSSAVGPTAEPSRTRGEPAAVLHVHVRVSGDAALPGVRAFLVLRRARELGVVDAVTPAEESLHEEAFGGELRFRLSTAEPVETLRERILAVGDLAEVEVVPNGWASASTPASSNGSPAIRSGADPDRAEAGGRGPAPARHVRVEAARLDTLMDRVGELVILRDRLRRAAGARPDEALGEAVDQAGRLIGQLRDEVLELRMVPVREVFGRFSRLVRDAARALGREVELVIDGDDTEMDRSVLERIGDPLVHLLRNAVDHGIEPPAERAVAGKPVRGRIRLSAQREGSGLSIRLSDDGRGIDGERVLRKATELGLVEAGAQVSAEEVIDLVTRPGLSTADRVSDVSGRGVGLDVVATQVRSLGGTLDIATRPGQGTTFTLRLPLTVGLMRVLLVTVDGTTYAIPVAHIAETVELDQDGIREVAGRPVAFLRDEPIPLVRLREVLRIQGAADPRPLAPVVVLETEEEWLGLEVDGLIGQQEVVTKPFDATRGTLPVFAGATILTDGAPAMMLDAAALIRHRRAPIHPYSVSPS